MFLQQTVVQLVKYTIHFGTSFLLFSPNSRNSETPITSLCSFLLVLCPPPHPPPNPGGPSLSISAGDPTIEYRQEPAPSCFLALDMEKEDKVEKWNPRAGPSLSMGPQAAPDLGTFFR